MNQYKIIYKQNGGRFRVFVDANSLEKAIADFRRKAAFSLVEITEVTYVKSYPLNYEQWENINKWFIRIFGVAIKRREDAADIKAREITP